MEDLPDLRLAVQSLLSELDLAADVRETEYGPEGSRYTGEMARAGHGLGGGTNDPAETGVQDEPEDSGSSFDI